MACLALSIHDLSMYFLDYRARFENFFQRSQTHFSSHAMHVRARTAGWKIDPVAKAAAAKAFNSTYIESTTLESVGIPSGPYGMIVKPMLADLTDNSILLQQIIDNNQLNNRTVDHAIEFPGRYLPGAV